jgi:hypothetical protein
MIKKWWINTETYKVYDHVCTNGVEVVEKSAYDALLVTNQRAKEALEKLAFMHGATAGHLHSIAKEALAEIQAAEGKKWE